MRSTNRLFYEYDKLTADGFGRGTGENYKSYLSSFRQRSCAVRGATVVPTCGRRLVHVLSTSEEQVLRVLDWEPSVIDIREQYPLDPRQTTAIADRLGIPHPGHTRGGAVMTTDFLVEYLDANGLQRFRAFQVKDSPKALENKRTAGKLQIEKTYWEERGISWRIVFASRLSPVKLKNLNEFARFRSIVPSAAEIDEARSMVRVFLNSDEKRPLKGAVMDYGGTPFLLALKLLCAHKIVSMPIDEKRFLDCTAADFQEVQA